MDTELNKIRVLETIVLHATDVIYWLDGTTAESVTDMGRIDQPVFVQLTNPPRGLKWLNKTGQMAFWRRGDGVVVNGIATEAQRARPAVTPFAVAGVVSDAYGLYNPRAFSLMLGSGEGHGVPLYRSPAGAHWPPAGGVQGSIRAGGTSAAVPWALLTLTVVLSDTDTMIFRAQADRNGDFAVTLNRLPPLPESADAYPAQLSVRADLAATPNTPADVDLLEPVLVCRLNAEDFQTQIDLAIRPGEVQRVNSFNRSFLACTGGQ